MNSRTQFPEILYEDAHILVCVKPHGTATQSRQAGKSDMVKLLKNYIYQNAPDKGEPYLAVIHRLDQPVKGILVFAKTPFAARELNRQLTHQGFGKYYRALVEGRPPKDADTLEDYMAKDNRTNLSYICAHDTAGARLARLCYRVVPEDRRYFREPSGDSANRGILGPQSGTPRPLLHGDHTELEIRLDTGRHHQIRVQLSHMGCPIAGDTKYNPNCNPHGSFWQNICLCACRLEFRHPQTRELLQFRLENAVI